MATWPRWYYGPKGESAVFEGKDEVPDGWAETPAAFAKKDEPAPEPDEAAEIEKARALLAGKGFTVTEAKPQSGEPRAADQPSPEKVGPGENLSVTQPPPAPDDRQVTAPVNPRVQDRATGTLPMDTAGRAAAQAATASKKS